MRRTNTRDTTHAQSLCIGNDKRTTQSIIGLEHSDLDIKRTLPLYAQAAWIWRLKTGQVAALAMQLDDRVHTEGLVPIND